MKETKKNALEAVFLSITVIPIQFFPIVILDFYLNFYTLLNQEKYQEFNFLVMYFVVLIFIGYFYIKKIEKYSRIIVKQYIKKIIKIIFLYILFIMIFLAIASLLILLLMPETINFVNVLKLIVCTILYWVYYQKLKKFLAM